MNDDALKQLWQNQPLPALEPNVSALVAAARTRHRRFQRIIFWRDFREVGLALVLIPIFTFIALRPGALWTSYLVVAALVFVAGFLLLDRWQRRQHTASPGETIVAALGSALREVEHQIWLLRHVLWWYVGPIIGALLINDAYKHWRHGAGVTDFLGTLLFDFFLAAGIWWLNRTAVQRDLEPRRAELQALLDEVR